MKQIKRLMLLVGVFLAFALLGSLTKAKAADPVSVNVATYDELKAALENPDITYVNLTDDISHDIDDVGEYSVEYQIIVRGSKYLELNGNDIYVWDNWKYKNQGFFKTDDPKYIDISTLFNIPKGSWLVINDAGGGAVVSFDAAHISSDDSYNSTCVRNIFAVTGGDLTINGGEFNAGDNHKEWFWADGYGDSWSASFIGAAKRIHGHAHTVVAGAAIYATSGRILINGGEFVGRGNLYVKHYYPQYCAALSIQCESNSDIKIVINGGDFDGRCGADAVKGANEHVLLVNGGSFDVHRIETERIYHSYCFASGAPELYGTTYVPLDCINGNTCLYLNGELQKNLYWYYRGITKKVDLEPASRSANLSISTDSAEEAISTKWTDYYYNYTKGSNFTLTLNFTSFYYSDDMPTVSLPLSYETKWTIKEYKNGEPTGHEKNIKTNGNTLNLDEVLTYWDNVLGFEWVTDKNTHFVISAEMVEYYNNGSETYSHVFKSNELKIISTNGEITDWKLDLSQVAPDVVGSISVANTEHIRVKKSTVYTNSKLQNTNSTAAGKDSNGNTVYKKDPLKAGTTYYIVVDLEVDDNYAAAILPKAINTSSVKVVDMYYSTATYHDYRIENGYQDIYGRDITWISGTFWIVLEVEVLYPLEGTVSLGPVYTSYLSSWSADINATTKTWYGFQTIDDAGETVFAIPKKYTKAETAIQKLMESECFKEGRQIRMYVCADNYKGRIYSEWRTICKVPNNTEPKAAELSIKEGESGYSVTITNYDPTQEYILRTFYENPDDFTEADWDFTLDQTFDVKPGKFLIYTRFKETETFAAGSIVYTTTDYAGGSINAESLVLSQTALALEAKEEAYITAKLLPVTQTTTDAQYVRWSVSEGDPNLLSIRVDGHYEFWPADGYVTGSTICVYARTKGVVELTAEITLPGNVRAYDRCTIYISEGGEFFVENVTQPEEKVYLLPDDCFQMWEYDVTPSAAYWTASEGIVWKILKVEGDPSHFSLTESGWLETNDAVPGEKVYVYPDISSIYHYTAVHTISPVNPRCFEVKDYDAEMIVDKERIRSRSGSASKINTATYNTSEEVTYVSSNPEVATVDETGTVQMLTPGTTTITVKCGDLVETVEITVEACFHSYIRTDLGDGTHKKVCEECGDEIIEAHTLGETAVSDGEAIRACGCGYYELVEVPARPAELSITPAPHVHTIASVSGDIIYDTKAHWYACEDSYCPDYDGSITDYAEHTFKEESYTNEDGSTVTFKYCSVCGYKSEAEVSYLIAEKEEKASVSLPVYDLEDSSTHEAYTSPSTVEVTPTPESAPVETVPSPTPFPMAAVTATPTPVPIATKAPEATATVTPVAPANENTGSSLLIIIRIILAIIALALIGGICFGFKKLKDAKKEEKDNEGK